VHKNKIVAVVVPAYNEQAQIAKVIDTMPAFVDRIIIVNDCSSDRTAEIVKTYIKNNKEGEIIVEETPKAIKATTYNQADIVVQEMISKELQYFIPSEIVNAHPESDRIILINSLKRGGVGASIARGYKWCLDHQVSCTAVMAGDGQMDPDELQSIIEPVVNGEVDYVKGNRLIHRSAWLVIPKFRYFGNSILSILTKIASGYWHVSDTQCGYTAISLKALQAIRIHDIYKKYGMPNDLLVKLNIAFCSVREVEIKPVYGIGENSKMNVLRVMMPILWLLLRSFIKRLWIKYLFRDFHPLFLLYHFAFAMGLISIPYLNKIGRAIYTGQILSYETLLGTIFLLGSGFQSLLFAMWMDMQDNERLYK
jgi:glycosyltransferase involved in cell wall biosynthesis